VELRTALFLEAVRERPGNDILDELTAISTD
jgi:hypothetical protein